MESSKALFHYTQEINIVYSQIVNSVLNMKMGYFLHQHHCF